MAAAKPTGASCASERKEEIIGRMNDAGYKCWLLAGQALKHMKQGLEGHANDVITSFHKDLLQSHSPKTCSHVECVSKNIIFSGGPPDFWKFKKSCPAQVCDKWLSDIAQELQNVKASKNVYWNNSVVSRWPEDSWEVAKVFMEQGQRSTNSSPTECDVSALLVLMTNCKKFHCKTTGFTSRNVERIKMVRVSAVTLNV